MSPVSVVVFHKALQNTMSGICHNPSLSQARLSEPASSQASSQDYRDFGLGTVVGGANERRLLNRDGSFNPRRKGQNFFVSLHPYHFLLSISWRRFFATVVLGYLSINVFFALAYLSCGPDAIAGQDPELFGGTFGRASFSVSRRLAQSDTATSIP
jgi:hypothetical protein